MDRLGLLSRSVSCGSLASVAAAMLLAAVCTDAQAYGNKGVIGLHLGEPDIADGFYLYNPDGTSTGHYQQFRVMQKCIVDNDGWGPDSVGDPGKLVNLQPIGPTGSTDPRAGLLSGSLGVYDNSKGVSCTRMTAAINEELSFESLTGGFDRLELDMELKGNAVFELQIVGTPYKYTLLSGTNRSGSYAGPADPDHLVVNCEGGSDSGPDSGPSDNCLWVINDVGTKFSLTPTAGEGSLEGGGDHANPAVYTKIFLTSLIDVGTLGCDETNNKTAEVYADDGSAASCQVTRINPNNFLSGSCTGEIDYRLETFTFESKCRLDKTGGVSEQLAGSTQITFEPEARVAWDGVAKTVLNFTKPDGTQTDPFYAERCGGTLVPDSNGNPTIEEVLTGDLPGIIQGGVFVYNNNTAGPVFLSDENDLVPDNDYIDWACVLENTEEYLGDDWMQVTQTILFWGDIGFIRQ